MRVGDSSGRAGTGINDMKLTVIISFTFFFRLAVLAAPLQLRSQI